MDVTILPWNKTTTQNLKTDLKTWSRAISITPGNFVALPSERDAISSPLQDVKGITELFPSHLYLDSR